MGTSFFVERVREMDGFSWWVVIIITCSYVIGLLSGIDYANKKFQRAYMEAERRGIEDEG